jgi:hypothetical protein
MCDIVMRPRFQSARKHDDTAREGPHRSRRKLTAWHAQSGPLLATIVASRAAESPSNAVSPDCALRNRASNGARQPPPGHKAAGKSCTEPRGVQFGIAPLADVPPRVLYPESAAGRAGGGGDQAPAYLEGSLTVRRLRPFLRRRLKTSLPHFVSIRVRNPCVLMRRLLRGR